MRLCRFLPLAFVLINSVYAQKTLTIKGSETLFPVVQSIKGIMGKDTTIVISGGGSNVGMKSLMKDSVDVAMVSRNIRTQEKLDAARKGKVLLSTAIAKDPVAIVVNTKNPVSKLTIEQVRAIFSGEIKNWSQVGGANAPIQVWIRDEKSGTQTFFKEYVMHNEPFDAQSKKVTAHEAATDEIEKDPFAVTFVGITFTHTTGTHVKIVSIGHEGSPKFVQPVENGHLKIDYPIIRNLYLSYFEEDAAKVKPLISKAFSPAGQSIIREQGLFPVLIK
ncbi:MAG: phosphate ABC transporter substrate-binding protein [Cytophagales bacterium]|nr:phosphate ABC transporter substrate-binding protein [Cytophagales bacterium]